MKKAPQDLSEILKWRLFEPYGRYANGSKLYLHKLYSDAKIRRRKKCENDEFAYTRTLMSEWETWNMTRSRCTKLTAEAATQPKREEKKKWATNEIHISFTVFLCMRVCVRCARAVHGITGDQMSLQSSKFKCKFVCVENCVNSNSEHWAHTKTMRKMKWAAHTIKWNIMASLCSCILNGFAMAFNVLRLYHVLCA